MKISIKSVAIIIIATSIVLLKNYLIEYTIQKQLADKNIKVNDIKCSGFYNISCKLKQIKINYKHHNIYYTLGAKSLFLNNILDIYNSYNDKRYPNTHINIIVKNITLKDNKDIFEELSKKVNISLDISSSNNISMIVNRENLNIDINKSNSIYVSIKNIVIQNIFYELYKFIFLEMKSQDGIDIAKGLNISLGYPKSNFIPKEYFLQNSISRMIELTISEIESYDEFTKYNTNNQLSDILEFVSRQDGERKFNLVLPKIINKE